jgi:AraC-like DNA-binding protein
MPVAKSINGADVIRHLQRALASTQSPIAAVPSGDVAAAEMCPRAAEAFDVSELPRAHGWLFCVGLDTEVGGSGAARILALDLEQPCPRPFVSRRSMIVVVLRRAMDLVTDRLNAAPVDSLVIESGSHLEDATSVRLALLLRSTLMDADRHASAFSEHLLSAFAIHVVRAHGRSLPDARRLRGTLASWQLRRAQELLRANLDNPVRLREVADACRLSVSHFSRAFRQSTGQAPATWLRAQRVEAAKALLRAPTNSISEVAAACGFADQSHFTRVFHRQVGASPGEWRRVVVSAWQ